jgi:hypothetical protein
VVSQSPEDGADSRAPFEAARYALTFLPDCPYRDFCDWTLDQPQYAPRWLQVVGITSLLGMTRQLLRGLLDDTESARLARYGLPMTAYLTYEAISDNLAIGLARRRPDDPSHRARWELLRGFNDAMIARLRGAGGHAQELIQAVAPAAADVSIFRQSLSEHEHRALADAYVKAHPDVDPAAIEYAIVPALVANVETVAAVTATVPDHATAEIVRDGLVRRYVAVTTLLTRPPRTPEQLLTVGTDAILVVPTLAFYAGILAETVRPLDGYAAVLADNTLYRALTDAALLVRALNDCGTRLLEQNGAQRSMVMGQLAAVARQPTCRTLSDVVQQARPQLATVLTRLRKDLAFGEFNVCLDGIRDVPAAQAVDAFHDRLDHVSRAYRRARRSLEDTTRLLDRRLGASGVGDVITRFVEFHRAMYANPFSTELGEYAVARLRD